MVLGGKIKNKQRMTYEMKRANKALKGLVL